MFSKNANQDVEWFVILRWLLLIVCAGIMNATAFIGLGTFATHVTGFATLFGVEAAQLSWGNAIAALVVPLFFLVGSVISGLCVEARIRRQLMPHYDYVMFACSGLLVAACVMGRIHTFYASHNSMHEQSNFVLLSLICLSSGLMNAALSYSSRATLRVTHLTGVTTDLGRGLAEVISLRAQGQEGGPEVRLNVLRALTIFCFVLGSVAGAILYPFFYFNSLYVPAAYFAYAAFHGRRVKLEESVQSKPNHNYK